MSDPYPQVSATQRGIGKIALLAVILALIGNVVAFAYLRPYAILLDLEPLVEARELIHTMYVDEVDDQRLIDGALHGMANALGDQNTQYLTPEAYSTLNDDIKGSFVGIGAEIDIYHNRLRIITPLDNSPAWKAGVMPGDIVLSIDGKDTLGIDIFEAMRQLKGQAETEVTLKIRHRTGEVKDIAITRQIIEVTTIRGYRRNSGNGYDYVIDPKRKIGYLRLTKFGVKSYEEVKETLEKLKKQGLHALIFDLRNNPGGLLEGAAKMSDLFLTDGQTIVGTKGRGTSLRTIQATANTLLPNLPLVVLVNQDSASASEIFAGAMRDNDRALIVGERTFGKGSVQEIPELSKGALKLTTAYWYLPSGKMIHRQPDAKHWGVDPSPGCYVPMDDDQFRAMLTKRRESEVEDPYAKLTEPISPAWLREVMLDDPMAAALQAAQTKLDSGKWPRIGIDADQALAPPTEREKLARQKRSLLHQLEQVEAAIEELEQATDEEDQP